MTEPIPREDMIELLNRLGADQDGEVLEAAREVHARITAADMTWDELLVPDQADDDDESDESDAIESSDPDEETNEPAGAVGARDAESLALIDKLLAMRGISADLREELKDYKTDIAEGEFETRDHRYLRAVHARLSKRR